MNTFTIYDIVYKLVGSIQPVGETHIDDTRYENLKIMVDLVGALLTDIDDIVYLNKDKQEFSMKRTVEFVSKFYDELGISR